MKLYIVTRSDLKPGAQVAQSCHALRLFAEEHAHVDRYWYAKSNNLVCLAAKDESALQAIVARARAEGVAVSEFREPDFGDAVTAVAIEPDGAWLVANLPLCLR